MSDLRALFSEVHSHNQFFFATFMLDDLSDFDITDSKFLKSKQRISDIFANGMRLLWWNQGACIMQFWYDSLVQQMRDMKRTFMFFSKQIRTAVLAQPRYIDTQTIIALRQLQMRIQYHLKVLGPDCRLCSGRIVPSSIQKVASPKGKKEVPQGLTGWMTLRKSFLTYISRPRTRE